MGMHPRIVNIKSYTPVTCKIFSQGHRSPFIFGGEILLNAIVRMVNFMKNTTFNVIIVGDMLVELTSAALLAYSGKKVLVLEREDRVEGGANSFRG